MEHFEIASLAQKSQHAYLSELFAFIQKIRPPEMTAGGLVN